ncbi:lanthionine synthetase LanC family protein [Nitrosopumilus ureiphilus]|uniref:Lanthionine synthetase n=1 Tax=Nitrosopumilus ureiphilus TaxID=1470067 RepID=A0A7D5R2N1_9ARCH|nr:lanthionine synthetase LanC family protein [Nitrosopumilus ureiphilus]QLH06300.1 hypothetical protein C5F50_03820 [Nitrosopumilus ureiphilus]
MVRENFLNIAESIGNEFCTNAIWYEDKCNWIGRMENPDDDWENYIKNYSVIISYDSLGYSFYEGTSGIAYFLLQLFKITNKPVYLNTAKGAIRHALYKISKEKDLSFGFYEGITGVWFVSNEISLTSKDSKLALQGYKILKKIQTLINSEHMLDVIAGNAGVIPPLLSLYKNLQDEKILNILKQLGEEIISRASVEKIGISWDAKCNGADNALHNLTGFAHGAAGIGHSLVKLYTLTGDKKYLESAKKAFAYEDSHYIPEQKNWPDFRRDTNTEEDLLDLTGAMGWCHGSPGICISRLHIFELLEEEKYANKAQKALEEIKNQIQKNQDVFRDYSLCHGLGGIGDIFLYASKILKNKEYEEFAEFIGNKGFETYQKSNSWECGNSGGELLDLMTGKAGIAYFYLRLYDKSIPSVLAM